MGMTSSKTARAVREFRRLARLLLSEERPDHDAAWVAWQIRALYREIPGLVLTIEDLQEQDALDELLGVLHLADRLLVVLLRQVVKAPVSAHLRLAEVLVDGGELDGERAVESRDDVGLTFHGSPPLRPGGPCRDPHSSTLLVCH